MTTTDINERIEALEQANAHLRSLLGDREKTIEALKKELASYTELLQTMRAISTAVAPLLCLTTVRILKG